MLYFFPYTSVLNANKSPEAMLASPKPLEPMRQALFLIIKLVLMVLYAAAIASFAGLMEPALASRLQNISLIVLAVHLIELVVMFRHVKRYAGPLAASVLLTLLFGMLHWKPLADEHAKTQKTTPTP